MNHFVVIDSKDAQSDAWASMEIPKNNLTSAEFIDLTVKTNRKSKIKVQQNVLCNLFLLLNVHYVVHLIDL